MIVMTFKTDEGQELFANAVPRDHPISIGIREPRVIEMSDEEFRSIPLTYRGCRYHPREWETPGAVEGFERFNREGPAA